MGDWEEWRKAFYESIDVEACTAHETCNDCPARFNCEHSDSEEDQNDGRT